MFRLYFTLAVLFLATSLSTLASSDGGESGGGGGVAPAELATPAQIKEAVYESRLALTLYFNAQSIQEVTAPSPEGKLLFSGERDIFQIIQGSSIELNETAPCLDRLGKERDGSAPGSMPDSICVSLKTLSAKLTPDNFREQVYALVGHELSHLLGASEPQATALQKKILRVYQKKSSHFAADLRMKLATELHYFPLYFGEAKYWTKDLKIFSEKIYKIHTQANEAFTRQFFSHRGISALNATQANVWWGIYWKVRMLHEYACAQDPLNIRNSFCQKNIDLAFGNDDSISLTTIEARFQTRKGGQNPPNFKIQRITDRTVLDAEVDSLIALAKEFSDTIESLPSPRSPANPSQPEPLPRTVHPVEWSTNQVLFSADNFLIAAGSSEFYGSFQGVIVNSDPGDPRYFTLEATWRENGVEMRLNIYFEANETHWWTREIRTYNGVERGDWIYYYGDHFKRPRGAPFEGNFLAEGISDKKIKGTISIENLRIQPLFH